MTLAALLGIGNGCCRESFLERPGTQAIGEQEATLWDSHLGGEAEEAMYAVRLKRGGEGRGEGSYEWVLAVAG